MKVSFIFCKSQTYRSSLATISQRTSCLVRSRGPRLLTRSSSAPSLHEETARIRVLDTDIWEKGVWERTETGYGDGAVRVDVALMLGAAVVVVTAGGGAAAGDVVVVVDLEVASVRVFDVAVEVEPRVSLPCAA